jgi:hypothetical protein
VPDLRKPRRRPIARVERRRGVVGWKDDERVQERRTHGAVVVALVEIRAEIVALEVRIDVLDQERLVRENFGLPPVRSMTGSRVAAVGSRTVD